MKQQRSPRSFYPESRHSLARAGCLLRDPFAMLAGVIGSPASRIVSRMRLRSVERLTSAASPTMRQRQLDRSKVIAFSKSIRSRPLPCKV